MKIKGKAVPQLKPVLVVLPRDGEDFAIKAACVPETAYQEFDALVKEPKPPIGAKADGSKVVLTDDKDYLKSVSEYGRKRSNWMLAKSLLLGTPDLEFSLFKMGDPETWDFEKELVAAGLSMMERGAVLQAILQANSLDETKLEEARARFLRSAEAQAQG
jgi:hypothetical protein